MASYSVKFKPSADRDLRSLPKVVVRRVLTAIEGLRSEAFPRSAIKLSGVERLYRIRAGEYRIVYEIDVPARQVVVHYVRHRRDVYRVL